jgi:hypothetical protein
LCRRAEVEDGDYNICLCHREQDIGSQRASTEVVQGNKLVTRIFKLGGKFEDFDQFSQDVSSGPAAEQQALVALLG